MAYETPDKIIDFSPIYRFITGIVRIPVKVATHSGGKLPLSLLS